MGNTRAVIILVLSVLYGFGHPGISHARDVQGTLLDQGGAVYNVRAYGATGNGKTDDAQAIQATIIAAARDGGGVVYFPAGTYLLNNSVQVKRTYRGMALG